MVSIGLEVVGTRNSSRGFSFYGAAICLFLICFTASAATDQHVAHGTLSKVITFDHQVRRDLFHAERENVRSTAVSSSKEIPFEPAQQSGISVPLVDVSLNTLPPGFPLVPFHSTAFAVDRLPVLNL
jgi:hypothetical protein